MRERVKEEFKQRYGENLSDDELRDKARYIAASSKNNAQFLLLHCCLCA
jgi:hypothetical protein